MKIIIIGIIILVVIIVAICWAACIVAADTDEWEREVHDIEDESSNENRPRNK